MSPASRKKQRVIPTVVDFVTTPLGKKSWSLLLVFLLTALGIWHWGATHMADTADIREDLPFLLHYTHDELSKAYLRGQERGAHSADVIIFGTSLSKEALWQETDLENAVQQHIGRRLKILDFSSSDQTFAEAMYLLYSLPPGKGRLVVLFGSPTSFAKHTDLSNHFRPDFFLEKKGATINCFEEPFIRLHKRLYRQALKRFLRCGLPYKIRLWFTKHIYHSRLQKLYIQENPAIGLPKYEDHIKDVRSRMQQGYHAYHLSNMQMIETMLQFAHGMDNRLVYFEAPRLKNYEIQAFDEWWDHYQTLLASLESGQGLDRVELNEHVSLNRNDFSDGRHMVEVGRDKWSKVFTTWLAADIAGTAPM